MLLERIKQLVNGETGELASKQSNLYLIQKRNKELKKQVENKDMHIDLLRKKLIALDEQNVTRESLYGLGGSILRLKLHFVRLRFSKIIS